MIRSLLAGVALSVAAATSGLAQTAQTPPPSVSQPAKSAEATLLQLAWKNFLDAWATGDWAPFAAMVGDEAEFSFPSGPHAGRHTGANGSKAFRAWIDDMRKLGLRINATTISTVIEGNRGVFESASASVPSGVYKNTESITMEVRKGKIVAFREYWQELDPQAAATRQKP